jgi:hypothetical protein
MTRTEATRMTNLINELSTRVHMLEHAIKNQKPELPAPAPSPHALSAAREPHVADPDFFTGKRHTMRTFLSQCRLVFHANPNRFPSEQSRVAYAASYLRDTAFLWFQPAVDSLGTERPDPILSSFQAFAASLQESFGDPDLERTAEKRLSQLRQTASASAYAAEFRRLALDTCWNDASLCFHYHEGLKEALKDELAKDELPATLDALVEKTIRLDNRLHERFIEKKARQYATPNHHFHHQASFSSGAPPQAIPRPAPQPTSARPTTHAAPGYARMDLDAASSRRGPLPEAERDRRRRLGLCCYCGGPGHMANSCPAKRSILNATVPSSSLDDPADDLKGQGQDY